MLKSAATVVISIAVTLLWMDWARGVQFILIVFISGSIVFHLTLCTGILRQKLRELAAAGVEVSVTQMLRRSTRKELIRAVIWGVH